MTETTPYIGASISLISKAGIRYEGTLFTIDTEASNLALQNGVSLGVCRAVRSQPKRSVCVPRGGCTAIGFLGAVRLTRLSHDLALRARTVRSFGTEGRKKDGPQIPAANDVYDYIIFRGSDIQDLQVLEQARPVPCPQIRGYS